MRLSKAKLLIGVFVFFAYLSIGVFGLLRFSHMSETPMANCPYAENSFSVCDNSLVHINNWHQFSNAIFSSLFIFSLLILGMVLYFFDKRNSFNQKQYFYKWKYYLDNKELSTPLDKIIKWLSLFENSPSFAYRA